MRPKLRVSWVVVAMATTLRLTSPSVAQDGLRVTSVSPEARGLTAPVGTDIVVEFDRPLTRSSVTPRSFWAFGRWSGVVEGNLRFSNGDRTVTLKPRRDLSAGEQVMVVLSRDLQAMDGTFLRTGGYSYQFWTRAGRSGLDFEEVDRFSTRTTPEETSRAYGGFGTDLDGDGLLDLTIVNEDTNDLRTFMNLGRRRGLSHDYLRPAARVGNVPSPSEPSDFDRDGNVDVAIANTQGASVSILLGNGDGTFGPAQTIGVGEEPRGITLLDADGDGDIDVATSVFGDGEVALLSNDGSGRFAVQRTFGTRGGERAIAAGDMDEDGLLDLVVGTRTSQEILVWLNQGDGSFALSGRRPSGGESWMLVLGDVDGDRSEDVAVVNSDTDNAAILLGNGRGGLGPPRRFVTDPFPLATDLADLDGDGDLDWLTSSFFGDWMLFENTGAGGFALYGTFDAPQAASCSIALDLDNDGSLELALIDELEDEVVVVKSSSIGFASDFESGDTLDWSRTRGRATVVTPGLRGSRGALRVPIDDSRTKSFVESRHPAGESRWGVAFDLRGDEIDLNGRSVEVLRIAGGRTQVRLDLEEAGGGLQVRVFAGDGGRLRDLGTTEVSSRRSTRLMVVWESASGPQAADGSVTLMRNGRAGLAASGLSNGGATIKRVRLGLPAGSRGTAGGALLFDNYESGR